MSRQQRMEDIFSWRMNVTPENCLCNHSSIMTAYKNFQWSYLGSINEQVLCDFNSIMNLKSISLWEMKALLPRHTTFLLAYIRRFVSCLPVLEMKVNTVVIPVSPAAQDILQLYYRFKNTSIPFIKIYLQWATWRF